MNNYELIQKQFEEVIEFSQRDFVTSPITYNATELFEQWKHNKLNLRKYLPFFSEEQLIYEYPKNVSFGLDENAKRDRLERFIRELWEYRKLQEFLQENKANFFENRVVKEFAAPNGKVRRGMKIIKAFKLFLSEKDCNLKRLQDEASAILNEDKIEGKFCISIHPLDYISISDNDHNWHSCHALDSDYRAGNLSYMADKHTVVCYVKTGRDRKIANFPESVPWNSKKWRVLLFFDKDCDFVMAGKQYPLQSNAALDYFQKVYKEACEKVLERYGFSCSALNFSPWHKEQIHSIMLDGYEYKFHDGMIPYGSNIYAINDIYSPTDNALQYNDILRNDTYRSEVKYAYAVQNSFYRWHDEGISYGDEQFTSRHLFSKTNSIPIINAGEEVKCLHCGEEPIRNSDAMLCDKCCMEYINPYLLDDDYFPTCEQCGVRFLYYEGTWHNGERICSQCYSELEGE